MVRWFSRPVLRCNGIRHWLPSISTPRNLVDAKGNIEFRLKSILTYPRAVSASSSFKGASWLYTPHHISAVSSEQKVDFLQCIVSISFSGNVDWPPRAPPPTWFSKRGQSVTEGKQNEPSWLTIPCSYLPFLCPRVFARVAGVAIISPQRFTHQ